MAEDADISTPSPTDGTVADLKDHLATVETVDDLAALKAAEEDGKNRATALAAIDDRAAELDAASTQADPDKELTLRVATLEAEVKSIMDALRSGDPTQIAMFLA